ncbi:DUF3619 family protein [Massilia sp. CF038]|uniref:DUF3619 family protein n=1 Tax=Massilia sp. CF038 TaxID=1881045 RepID=UPI00092190E5|nr:DUF3619 family protein [Massilia sp. CF038]SHG55122.1 Protein of unknown function [Massilia sp. CF038]
MNADDLNFAYKVRHALNEHLDHLPASTADRLASARKAAVARKKPHRPVLVATGQLAGQIGAFFSFSFLGRMSAIVPLLALVAGLAGIYQYEEQQRIAEVAELDAEVLSDELPLTAYLDEGFNAYLEQRAQ